MSKKSKQEVGTESETLEVIELAIEDMEVLARAFRFIDDLCREANAEAEQEQEELPPEGLWN